MTSEKETNEARKGLHVVRILGHLFWDELCEKVDSKLIEDKEKQ